MGFERKERQEAGNAVVGGGYDNDSCVVLYLLEDFVYSLLYHWSL